MLSIVFLNLTHLWNSDNVYEIETVNYLLVFTLGAFRVAEQILKRIFNKRCGARWALYSGQIF